MSSEDQIARALSRLRTGMVCDLPPEPGTDEPTRRGDIILTKDGLVNFPKIGDLHPACIPDLIPVSEDEAERYWRDNPDLDRPVSAGQTPPINPLDYIIPGDQEIELKPRKWLVGDLFMLGENAIVNANPGVGKSAMMVAISARVINGEPFAGRKIGKREDEGHFRVLYVAGEDADGIAAQKKAHELQGLDMRAFDLFDAEAKGIDLSIHEHLAILIEVAKAGKATGKPYGLLVLDTIASLIGDIRMSEEDGAKKLISIIKEIERETGATVVQVAHRTKGQNGDLAGHHSIFGACYTRVDISRVRDGVSEATVEKQRHGPRGEKLRFRPVVVDVDGTDVAIAEPVEIEASKTQRPMLNGNERIALEALSDRMTQSEWSASARKALGDDSSARTKFSRAKKWLIENGYVSVSGEYVERTGQ